MHAITERGPFATDGAIVTLDISVLLGLTWLDVFKPNAVFLSPRHRGPADIFWAVVDTYGNPPPQKNGCVEN